MKTSIDIFLFLSLMIFLVACKKMIEVDSPKNQLTTDKVFSDKAAATAAVDNAYLAFDRAVNPNFNAFIGLYADDLNYLRGNNEVLDFQKSKISPLNGYNSNCWKNYYQAIYQCNDIIENLSKSNGLSKETIDAFGGEAKFLRAFAYFYLYNIYRNIPLITTTDVTQNIRAGQADSTAIFRQIISDLTDAKANLTESYRGNGRVRANKWAAIALLARVYLYQRNWAAAEESTSLVINSGIYGPLDAPSTVFLAGSRETILQFWTKGGYTSDGSMFLPGSGVPQFILSNELLSSFETGDQRATAWINTVIVNSSGSTTTYYYPYKYHNRAASTSNPEYLMALRLAEQILIRAEARSWMNNITGAQADINTIRTRASLPNTIGKTPDELLAAIEQERRVELFTEWGHRFFDLKRTGRLDGILGSLKPTWSTTQKLLPIPQTEINYDANLVQNPGY